MQNSLQPEIRKAYDLENNIKKLNMKKLKRNIFIVLKIKWNSYLSFLEKKNYLYFGSKHMCS